MRKLLPFVVVILAACGSGSPSYTTPTPVPTPTPSPAPAPPPPSFPNMLGGWGGTLTIATITRGTGARSSNTCNQTWIVTAQTAGDFSGSQQLSGGTVSNCSDSGMVNGTVSSGGTLTSLRFVGQPQNGVTICTRLAGDGSYSGVVSSAGNITAQTTDAVRCTTTFQGQQPVSLDADRTLTLSMTKR